MERLSNETLVEVDKAIFKYDDVSQSYKRLNILECIMFIMDKQPIMLLEPNDVWFNDDDIQFELVSGKIQNKQLKSHT